MPADDRTLRTANSARMDSDAPATWAATILHSPANEHVGRSFELRRPLRFGRTAGPEIDVAIEDRKMSRRHATLQRTGLVLKVIDEGSSNGTFADGVRVAGSVTVSAGAIVRMGDTLLEVSAPPAERAIDDPTLVGRAPAFLRAVERAALVAPSELPVLLLGETGTGKDVLARFIHARSGRRGPYVAVNCATLPTELAESALFGHKRGAFTGATADTAGYFAQAEGGTLFLDEIGELPLHQQAKLLRVLENHEYVPVGGAHALMTDVRVVAATHADLQAAGAFRADLYARLAGSVIRLPPLRARRGDILELAARFLGGARFSAHAAEALLLHPWPHNIRELRTAMQRLALVQPSGEVGRDAIASVLDEPPPRAASAPVPKRPSRAGGPTREELVSRLSALRGNVNRLADEFGKDPKQIYRWLKRHGLDPEAFR